MTKQIHVTMPDGSIWAVPAELVARHRAAYYAAKEGEASGKREYAYALGMNDDVLVDWAENNMNWTDVAHAARLYMRAGSVDFQEGWLNGAKRVVQQDNEPT